MAVISLVYPLYMRRTTPLGIAYLAAALEQSRIPFTLSPYPIYKNVLNLKRLYDCLAQSGPVIAVSCWADMLPFFLAVLARIKKNYPEKIIILGGIGATEVAEEIMRAYPFIDFVVKGSGILRLPQLIRRMHEKADHFKGIDGVLYRQEGSVRRNGYHGFFLEPCASLMPSYRNLPHAETNEYFNIATSSGCPFRCSFCAIHSLVSGKTAWRDLEAVVEEICMIKKLRRDNPATMYEFCDEAFILDRERVFSFCSLLKKKKIAIQWSCYGRIDAIDDELLQCMADSGCSGIFYGIESGSDRLLRKMGKGFTIAEATRALLLSRKLIRRVTASFIYLFPFERYEDFIETMVYKRYLESKGIVTQLHALCPIKNSTLYRRYKGRLFLSRERVPHADHIQLPDLPRECLELIEKNPQLFPFYHHYRFNDFNRMVRMLRAG